LFDGSQQEGCVSHALQSRVNEIAL